MGEVAWPNSGGGFGVDFPLPSWQDVLANALNGASSTVRNVPDLAMEANPDNYICVNGSCAYVIGGNSIGGPRWAALIAMANEQAALNGMPPLGLINPALYAIGNSPAYGQAFHDITSGDNSGFSAVPGYDLVTGWGTPTGPNLINLLAGAPSIVAAVEPSSRSVAVGAPATVFATLINSGGTALANCRVQLLQSAPAGLSLTYQTTDPATNTLTGAPNVPVTIAAGDAQSFLLAIQSDSAVGTTVLPFDFGCDGTAPTVVAPGVNTVDLAISSTPEPDLIALAETPTRDGIVNVSNGTGAFAVAAANAGSAGQITASVDFGGRALPIDAVICETDPTTGQCKTAPSASVALNTVASGATPSFSVFVGAASPVAFDPTANRIFVRFRDTSGIERGAISVAVRTDPRTVAQLLGHDRTAGAAAHGSSGKDRARHARKTCH